jgi:NadR type nicotinamide-nucleotide adenylyltransferase
VTLIGAESTGKTTAAQALAAAFHAPWVPEYARSYLDAKRAPLAAEDVDEIARGQVAAEDEGRRRASGLLILDTDLVSTMVYARHYYGACPPWIEEAARARRADLYLLHHPDVPWVADGDQRDQPAGRDLLHHLFREALLALGAHTVDVTGSWDERVERSKKAIRALLEKQG